MSENQPIEDGQELRKEKPEEPLIMYVMGWILVASCIIGLGIGILWLLTN